EHGGGEGEDPERGEQAAVGVAPGREEVALAGERAEDHEDDADADADELETDVGFLRCDYRARIGLGEIRRVVDESVPLEAGKHSLAAMSAPPVAAEGL